MKFEKINALYFSPAGTTRRVTEILCEGLGGEVGYGDLLRDCGAEGVSIPSGELLAVAVPVYFGRVPVPCLSPLRALRGDNTPAVAVAVYGNRDFDDALLELSDILKEGGFNVIAAAAVVAEHSVMTGAAHGRPDSADEAKLKAFAADILALDGGKTPEIKGNRPYRDGGSLPFKPKADKKCNACGACAGVCPVSAIPKNAPNMTDEKLCISCTACINACPQGARAFHGVAFKAARLAFEAKLSARREPEFFV